MIPYSKSGVYVAPTVMPMITLLSQECDRLFYLLQLQEGRLLRAFAGSRRTLQEPVDDGGRVARQLMVVLGAVDTYHQYSTESARPTDRPPDVGHVTEMLVM